MSRKKDYAKKVEPGQTVGAPTHCGKARKTGDTKENRNNRKKKEAEHYAKMEKAGARYFSGGENERNV